MTTAAEPVIKPETGPIVTVDRVLIGIALVLLLVAPLITSDFFVSFVLTQALLLGVAAASLIFLAAYTSEGRGDVRVERIIGEVIARVNPPRNMRPAMAAALKAFRHGNHIVILSSRLLQLFQHHGRPTDATRSGQREASVPAPSRQAK